MNLGRISVKRIFLLVSGGMAVSMLAICAVFFAVTGQMWILAFGMLLMLCAFAWMFLLSIAFGKRLSVFTRELNVGAVPGNGSDDQRKRRACARWGQ